MKNLVIIALAIILGLTSCQKEQLDMTNQTVALNAATHSEAQGPQKPMNSFGAKSKIKTNGISSKGQLFTTKISHPKELTKNSAARNFDITIDIPLLCGDSIIDHNKQIFDSNNSKTNNYNATDYYNNGQGCLSGSHGFNGRDAKHNLWVEFPGTYSIQLSQLSKDLDVFLYSLDANGDLDQCLGYGLNGGTNNELIVADLDMGVYAIIVDAYVTTDESDFKLKAECAVLLDLNCEQFEDKNTGAITPNAPNWVKYSSGSGDATVTTTAPASYSKTLKCDIDSDVVYLLGKEHNAFVHYLSWEIYVPTGKSAAFAFEKYNQPGLEHSLRVFMSANRSISIYTKGQSFSSPFTYQQGQWITVEVEYDLNGGTSRLKIDGNHIVNFDARIKTTGANNGQNKLAGINFWTQTVTGEFYLEGICHSYSNPWLTFLVSDSGTLEL